MFKKIFSDYKKRPKTQMFVQSSVAQLLAEGRQTAQVQASGRPSYCLSPQWVTAGGCSTGKHANQHNEGQNCSVNVTKTLRNAT